MCSVCISRPYDLTIHRWNRIIYNDRTRTEGLDGGSVLDLGECCASFWDRCSSRQHTRVRIRSMQNIFSIQINNRGLIDDLSETEFSLLSCYPCVITSNFHYCLIIHVSLLRIFIIVLFFHV